jgi:hypothetical protein
MAAVGPTIQVAILGWLLSGFDTEDASPIVVFAPHTSYPPSESAVARFHFRASYALTLA